MIKAVVFDLDDTLYYEKNYVKEGFKSVAKYIGDKYELSYEEILKRMSEILEKEGRGKIFNRICDEYSIETDIKILVDIYRNTNPKINLYEDSIKFLKWARKNSLKLGIITDGCAKVQWNKIQALNVKEYVDEIIVTDDLGREFWKPHIKPFKLMLDKLEVQSEECIYIGDNPKKDFIGAKSLGINTIRLMRENGDHINVKLDKEYEADIKISFIDEIRKYIELVDVEV